MNPENLTKRVKERRNQIILIVVVTLLFAIGTGTVLARQTVRRGWPQTQGTVTVAGLNAPVTVVRDAYGVPHIFAETDADLFFAQGYVHAQDRFWQMVLSRRRGRGTLTELLGETQATADAAWQALELPRLATGQLLETEIQHLTILDAYAAGVNAWLAQSRDRLPFEFTLLRLRGQEIADPAPWTPEDSMIVALALGWQVGAPQVSEDVTAQVVERVGPERAAFLLGKKPGEITLQPLADSTEALPGRWALSSRVTLVSGDQTQSGALLLAADLPTNLSLPAPWYVLAWHRQAPEKEGNAGASVPGLPGLLMGSDAEVWAAWPETQSLSLPEDTLPWKRWLLGMLLNTGEIMELEGDQVPATRQKLQARQMDTYSARAARLIPFLTRVEPRGWRQERVTEMLRRWNYKIDDNNKEAPFFAVYQRELARAAFADELGETLFEAFATQSPHYQAALDQIIQDPDDPWWDDVTTPERELREDMLERAYDPALEWIGRNYGDLHMLWEWDLVHGSRLHHPLGDAWPWDQLLSRDLAPDGWTDTINASPGGLPCAGGVCLGGDFYRANAVYGYRQIVDARDPSTLWFTLLPGQSGHPFHPHYDDLMAAWLVGEYKPLRLAPSPEAVEGTQSTLKLIPERLDAGH